MDEFARIENRTQRKNLGADCRLRQVETEQVPFCARQVCRILDVYTAVESTDFEKEICSLCHSLPGTGTTGVCFCSNDESTKIDNHRAFMVDRSSV